MFGRWQLTGEGKYMFREQEKNEKCACGILSRRYLTEGRFRFRSGTEQEEKNEERGRQTQRFDSASGVSEIGEIMDVLQVQRESVRTTARMVDYC